MISNKKEKAWEWTTTKFIALFVSGHPVYLDKFTYESAVNDSAFWIGVHNPIILHFKALDSEIFFELFLSIDPHEVI